MPSSRVDQVARSLPARVVTLSLLGAVCLGLTPALAALSVVISAAIVVHGFSGRSAADPVSRRILFLVFYSAGSAIIFGGIGAAATVPLIDWIGGEGRFFLYYWPALAILALPARHFIGSPVEQRLGRAFAVAAAATLIATVLDAASVAPVFSTHHGAGAVSATIIIIGVFRFESTRQRSDLAILIAGIASILISNSRTSLIAVVVAVTIVHLSAARLAQLIKVAGVGSLSVLVMALFLPAQFDRLAQVTSTEVVAAVITNVRLGFEGEGQSEVARAFDLAGDTGELGNTNLNIRGQLWGRSLHEGLRSPALGIGFGRMNDLGREFTGTPYVLYPAVAAANPNPSNLTAHNSYLHIFNELGVLGFAALYAIIRRLRSGLHGDGVWERTGRCALVTLLLMAVTQHAFGAPIYGLSIFVLTVLCYRMSNGPSPATSPMEEPSVIDAAVARLPQP